MSEMDDMVEVVARTIAKLLGDNFDHAFYNKADWIDQRGISGGRFRDVNEPFQNDYLEAAHAAITAMLDKLKEPSEGMSEAFFEANASASTVFAGPDAVWKAMLEQARKEAGL